jgi:MFS family permease
VARTLFYGYVILAICFLNMLVMRGITSSFSVFYIALLDEFRWSHGTAATIASVNFLVYALVSPLVGWAFDRVGPRRLMPLAGALVGAGFLLSSLSRLLWQLYATYGVVVALGQSGLGFVIHAALISRWFVRHRGMAIGLATMGQGIGALLLVPLAQVIISTSGWRAAFAVMGMIFLAVVVPANAIFQRGSPADLGQLPDGGAAAPAGRSGNRPVRVSAGRAWTVGEALRSFPFWSITLGHFALGSALFMIYTHLVAHLTDQGLSRLLAAFVFGLIGFVRVGGEPLWGLLSDRLGRDRAYAIAISLTLLGVVGLALIVTGAPLWVVYAIAVLYGISHTAGNPTYGAMIGDIFGGPTVGIIFGFLEVSFGLGSALGAWAGGYLYDATGSYHIPISLTTASFATSYVAIRLTQRWHLRNL